jgi:hypothetical protein
MFWSLECWGFGCLSSLILHPDFSFINLHPTWGMWHITECCCQIKLEGLNSAERGGLARKAEELLCKSFYQTLETDDDKVLDTSQVRKRTLVLPPSGENTSLEKTMAC